MTTEEAQLGQIFTPAARELAGGWRRKAEELKATADAPDLELPGELPVHPELLHGMAEALNLAAGQLEALALVADRLAGEAELPMGPAVLPYGTRVTYRGVRADWVGLAGTVGAPCVTTDGPGCYLNFEGGSCGVVVWRDLAVAK